MNIRLENNILYIVPNSLKMKVLKYLDSLNQIYDISFLSLEEVKEKYFFKIRDEALLYLLDKTNENIDVLKTILTNLYSIDLNKKYKNNKLNRLQCILKDLKDNNYLIYDKSFINYVKTKKIYVLGYPMLNKYEEDMLNDLGALKLDIDGQYKLDKVYKFNDIKDEVISLALRIRKLNQEGVNYNKIFLAGIDNSYIYLLENIFKMFDIPLYYKSNNPLFSLISVKKYLDTKDINVIKSDEIRNKILEIEDNLITFKGSKYYDMLFERELRNNSLKTIEKLECVKVFNDAIDIPYLISGDEYLFVLSFNQNIIPKVYKDEEFLSDKMKNELFMLTSLEKNKISKLNLLNVFRTIKNLFVSYKLTSLTNEFASSSLLNDMNVSIVEEDFTDYNYSLNYNNYLLGTALDEYYKFNSKKDNFDYLINNIDSKSYNSFNHKYKGINRLSDKVVLSYSSFNDYSLCPFKYYLKYILKLDEYTKTFNIKIGNIFHNVLNDSYKDDFNFDDSFNRAVNMEELDNRESFLLERLKEELLFIIDNNKVEEENSALNNFYGERKIEVSLGDNSTIKGFIDKILYKNKDGKDYYALFDYKTGNVTLDFNHIKDGLYMQLPIYIYLIEKSNIFSNPIFAGSYYQTLLKSSKTIDEKKSNLKLKGYSAMEEDTLEYLDINYKDSSWIKSLAYTKSDVLSSRSKVLSKDEIKDIVKNVDYILKDTVTLINNNSFDIKPVILNNKNISCLYCPYNEICFHDVTDNKYIDDDINEVI